MTTGFSGAGDGVFSATIGWEVGDVWFFSCTLASAFVWGGVFFAARNLSLSAASPGLGAGGVAGVVLGAATATAFEGMGVEVMRSAGLGAAGAGLDAAATFLGAGGSAFTSGVASG